MRLGRRPLDEAAVASVLASEARVATEARERGNRKGGGQQLTPLPDLPDLEAGQATVLSAFDFTEGAFAAVERLRVARRRAVALSAVLALACAGAGIEQAFVARSTNTQAQQLSAQDLLAKADAAQSVSIDNIPRGTLLSALGRHRTQLASALAMTPDVEKVVGAVSSATPAGVSIQSLSITTGTAATAAVQAAGGAGGQAQTVIPAGSSVAVVTIHATASSRDAAKDFSCRLWSVPAFVNPMSVPTSNGETSSELTTVAFVAPSAFTTPRAALLDLYGKAGSKVSLTKPFTPTALPRPPACSGGFDD